MSSNGLLIIVQLQSSGNLLLCSIFPNILPPTQLQTSTARYHRCLPWQTETVFKSLINQNDMNAMSQALLLILQVTAHFFLHQSSKVLRMDSQLPGQHLLAVIVMEV
jgi:hypothetical protein